MFNSTAELPSWLKLDKTSRTQFETIKEMENAPEEQNQNQETMSALSPDFYLQKQGMEIDGSHWFRAIQQKIAVSTIPSGYEVEEDGSWIRQNVAATALIFLAKSSNEFFATPYLYSSPSGDLVAEFEENDIKSTFIISADNITAFAMVGGKPIFKIKPALFWSPNQIKIWHEKITVLAQGKKNGQLES
jgi:hypothetical protein